MTSHPNTSGSSVMGSSGRPARCDREAGSLLGRFELVCGSALGEDPVAVRHGLGGRPEVGVTSEDGWRRSATEACGALGRSRRLSALDQLLNPAPGTTVRTAWVTLGILILVSLLVATREMGSMVVLLAAMNMLGGIGA